jgi:hypothetical protein
VVSAATAQKKAMALPAARAADRGSPAPSERETSDAPPTPTVAATAPITRITGATRLTAAIAAGPTPRATNQALVSA